MPRPEDKQISGKLLTILSNFAKGAGCFELIPDRKYAFMKTARHSHWWEIHNLQVVRRFPAALKTMERHVGFVDTYAVPAALFLDVARISINIYKDEGIGVNVIRCGGSVVGGWIGGYICAQGGYKLGEVFGQLVSQDGLFAVVFGYIGGVVGAQYGDKLARILLLQKD